MKRGPRENEDVTHLFSYAAEKAGMTSDAAEKKRQHDIIHEASYGSAFHKHQQKNDEDTEKKIADLRRKKENLTLRQLEEGRKLWAQLSRDLELRRDLSRVCIVIDMDAFYVSVELRDRPDLKDKPVAVGTGVVTTANYVARKFGVRSAMPTFMAKQLCPALVVLPTQFDKYIQASNVVRSIVSTVDPDFKALSLDEVYVDLTVASRRRALESRSLNPPLNIPASTSDANSDDLTIEEIRKAAFEITSDLRKQIFESTGGLTCSAGIANNFSLAKICSDFKKPNGQFELAPTRDAILNFVGQLPIRKVSGIGRVTEKIITETYHCSQVSHVRDHMHMILMTMSEKSKMFLARSCLGLSDGEVNALTGQRKKDDEEVVKSVGNSRTFQPTKEDATLQKWLCELLTMVVERCNQHSPILIPKCVCVHLKWESFEVVSKQRTMLQHTCNMNILLNVAKELLKELMATNTLAVRLLGVNVSGFKGFTAGGSSSRSLGLLPGQRQLPFMQSQVSNNNLSLVNSGNTSSIGDNINNNDNDNNASSCNSSSSSSSSSGSSSSSSCASNMEGIAFTDWIDEAEESDYDKFSNQGDDNNDDEEEEEKEVEGSGEETRELQSIAKKSDCNIASISTDTPSKRKRVDVGKVVSTQTTLKLNENSNAVFHIDNQATSSSPSSRISSRASSRNNSPQSRQSHVFNVKEQLFNPLKTNQICPVCSKSFHVTQAMMSVHVDACLSGKQKYTNRLDACFKGIKQTKR